MDRQNSSLSGCNTDIPEKKGGSRVLKAVLYGICALIVAFFIYALYLGTIPQVSNVYKMFYIDRTLSTWPGEDGFYYEPGVEERCIAYNKYKKNQGNLCLRMGTGWSTDEKGSVNKGDTSIIYYPINGGLKNGGKLIADIESYSGSEETQVFFSYTPEEVYNQNNHNTDSDNTFVDDGQVTEMIGSFSGKGKFEFSLPKVMDKELNKVIFKTKGGAFLLKTIEIRRNS